MKRKEKPPRKNQSGKKPRSIFFKIGLFLVPTIVILDLVMLLLAYNITYSTNLGVFKTQVRNAAEMAVQYSQAYNLKDDESFEKYKPDYSFICDKFDVTYVFVLDPDIENNSETYLAIGFGRGASEDAKKTRYRGVTVTGKISQHEIDAYNGDPDEEPLHERNQFDDSLVYYLPCNTYYDANKLEYVDYDRPILVGAEISLNRINAIFRQRFLMIALLTISLTLLIVAAFSVILFNKVTKPVRRISKRMSGFVTDREQGFEKLDVNGNDEFAQMSRAFNTMADEIDSYIEDIDALNREKHTQEAELNIARRIQMGLLLPDHISNDRCEINAYMLPARDVGGDLYDYQLLDDGRVFIAIADVSGKGISGALFMSRAITLLHQFMLSETSPAKILTHYNDTLTKRNPGGLFITTFLAVWDPLTGELTYSNAGHNYPYILSDKLIMLKDAHGIAAGLFEGEEYENATIKLNEGDTLFLYTDGVNEAKNAKDAFYSTERLEEKLSEFARSDSADTLDYILNDLNSFTHGAEQSDDITMLCLHIKDQPNGTILQVKSEPTQLPHIKEAILALSVSDTLKKKLILAAEEIFINICSYAYDEPDEVELKIVTTDNGVDLTFVDGGKPFDPTADLLDIDEYDHENAIGGLGRFLTFSIADRYRYIRQDDKNILYLSFNEEDPDDHQQES